MSSDSLNIWNKYKIINEISQRYIDEVNEAVRDNQLPFNNIFGDSLRLVLPIIGAETYEEILNVIKKIPNYSGFDPEKKEIIKLIKLDPKYGGGLKEQRINLGKALSSSLKLPDELKKKYLNWYANYSSNIPEMDNLKNYSIILSRSPIDVLRMSDSGKIKSCHSQGGTYFSCAIQEAKTGGPIAYLVKSQDLKSIDPDDLQNEEIFSDPDRKIRGIVPLSRLRIRRYINTDSGEELAIPEIRVYGDRLAGFYDSIKEFLKQKQTDFNIDTIYKDYKNHSIIRTGGSYTDSSDSELFNTMFSTDKFHGSVEHEDAGDEDRRDQFETELNEFQRRFANGLGSFGIAFDVDETDDEIYYYANAGMVIDLDEFELDLIHDFPDIQADDIRSVNNYNPNGKYGWQKRVPYTFRNKLDDLNKFKNFLEVLYDIDHTNFFEDDLGGMDVRGNSIHLYVCFGDDCNGTSWNTDDYADFCRKVKGYDDKASDIKKIFISALKRSGYIENIEPSEILNPKEFDNKLSNSTFDSDDYELNFILDPALTFNINENTDSLFVDMLTNQSFNTKEINNAMSRFLANYLKQYYSTKSNNYQLKFKSFMESVRNVDLDEYGIQSTHITVSQDAILSSKQNVKIRSTFSIKIAELDKNVANVLLFIDKHSDDVYNALRFCIRSIYRINDHYTKSLQKVYSKYFN